MTRRLKRLLTLTLAWGVLLSAPQTRVRAKTPNARPVFTHASGDASAEPYLLRSTAKGDEFSILMPAQPTAVVDKLDSAFKVDGQTIDEERIFSCYADGVVYLVKVYMTGNGKKAFDEFRAMRRKRAKVPDVSTSEVVAGAFKGEQEEERAKSWNYGEPFYSRTQYFPTKHNLYVVSAAARDDASPSLGDFFSSIRLGDAATDAGAKNAPAGGSPATSRAAAFEPNPAPRVFKPEEVTRKAIIVWHPDPGVYQEMIQLNRPIVKMKLQMILNADGSVSDVKIVSGTTQAINEKVLTAAKYMRFLPALKDGRHVSQLYTFDYEFSR